MELVKTQMQVNESATVSATMRNILQNGGFKGACRGLAITFTREIPAFGVYFGSYEIMIRQFGENTMTILAGGGVAGILSWLLTYPQDVIKSRLQADGFGKDQVYKGSYDCFKRGVEKEGYQFLTRGLGSSVIRAFPVNAATFYVYTFIMKMLSDNQTGLTQELSSLQESIKEKVAISDTSQTGVPDSSKEVPYLSTVLSTDMPNIIVVDKATRPAQWRIYPEQMLYACNSKPVDTSLNCLHSRGSLNKFNQFPEDNLTDIHSVHSVISITKDSRNLPAKYSEGDTNPTQIRMSDFLLPSNLLSSCRFEKIYGFYYLLS